MPKLVGYARISRKDDQTLDLQIDALRRNGCEAIYKDKISGAKCERPGLDKCLEDLQTGDTLIVWRLDRLGRSMPHLVELIGGFKKKGICFKSLSEGVIDTTNASGELIFNIFSCLCHFERCLIQERTRAGLEAARARGRFGGRRPILVTDPRVVIAKKMHADKSIPVDDICNSLKISKATLYRFLKLKAVPVLQNDASFI